MATKKLENKIKFLKLRDVKSPSRGYPTDAGIDFFVPKFNVRFIEDLEDKNPDLFAKKEESCCNRAFILGSTTETITLSGNTSQVEYKLSEEHDNLFKFDRKKGKAYFVLAPHARVLIPSGIHSRMEQPGRALIAFNKSGVASKLGLDVGACVVDYTYQGEIHLNLINTSSEIVRIYEDQKIIQFVEMPIFTNELEVIEGSWNEDIEMKDQRDHVKFFSGMKKDRTTGGFGSTDAQQLNS